MSQEPDLDAGIEHDTESDLEDDASLANQILARLELSKFDDIPHEFVPEGATAGLITEAAILTELPDLDPQLQEDQDLTRFILSGASKLFIITVFIDISDSDLCKAMKLFKQHDFRDNNLPITRDARAKDGHVLAPFRDKKVWKRARIYKFYECQWKFLAPVFKKTVFRYDLPAECILPFTWVSNTVKEGTFGRVFEFRIHESHQEDPVRTIDGSPAHVAIKEMRAISESLQAEVDKNWEAEAKALDEISDLNHPHIIRRIAAITRGEKRYFMFQWADGGSLRDFWEETPRPALVAGFVRETLMQLRGLADALHGLHNFKGHETYRHGDLKPENILRFKDCTRLGRLQIADMGLAKHHPVGTQYRPNPTSTRYGTVRYEPPEAVTAHVNQARSRLYDIWSMGCIILESMVWLLYGYEELQKFNERVKGDSLQEASYFTVKIADGKQVAEVHPAVIGWMNHISEDPECKQHTAMADLLDLVRTKLLVVPLPNHRKSFDIRPKVNREESGVSVTEADEDEIPVGPCRATAEVFRDTLDEILGKTKDERYLCTEIRRDKLRGPRAIPKLVTPPTDEWLSPDVARRPGGQPNERFPKPEPSRLGLPPRLATSQKQNVSGFQPP